MCPYTGYMVVSSNLSLPAHTVTLTGSIPTSAKSSVGIWEVKTYIGKFVFNRIVYLCFGLQVQMYIDIIAHEKTKKA